MALLSADYFAVPEDDIKRLLGRTGYHSGEHGQDEWRRHHRGPAGMDRGVRVLGVLTPWELRS